MENNVDRGSSLLIPTSTNGGCIIVGENKIQYKSSDGSASITIAPTLMKVGKMPILTYTLRCMSCVC